MVPFSIQYSKVCSRVVQALIKRQIQTLKNSWYLVHLEFLGKTLAWTNQGLKGQPFAWHKDEGGVLVGLFAHHDGNNFETNCVKKASLLLNYACRCKKKRFDETLRDHTLVFFHWSKCFFFYFRNNKNNNNNGMAWNCKGCSKSQELCTQASYNVRLLSLFYINGKFLPSMDLNTWNFLAKIQGKSIIS